MLMFWPPALIRPALFRVPEPTVVISWLSGPLKRSSPPARLFKTAPLLSTVTWLILGWLMFSSPALLTVTLSKYTSLLLLPVMLAVAPLGITSVPPPVMPVSAPLRASMPIPPLTVRVLPLLRVSVFPGLKLVAPLTTKSRSRFNPLAFKLMGIPKTVEPDPCIRPPSRVNEFPTLRMPAPVSRPLL